MSLSDQDVIRFSRHIILPEVGGRGQKRLKEASVLVAGLGASGSAAALYLAAAGVGGLTLWDPGVVTPQDLQGAIAHDWSRIGLPRARSAAVPLRAIYPENRMDVLEREADLLGDLPAHNVVVLSAGNWAELGPAAVRGGASAVFCGAHGADGAVTVVTPGSPCLGCLGAEQASLLGLFPDHGGIAAAAGVVGVMAATEAIKLILGVGTPLAGRVMRYNGWDCRFEEASFGAREGCACWHG
ncbi:MAG: molybdopterin biosynthesis protein [Symbiobacteriaceae bacterium]|nr:molybdopterin biosynthesis protein [Symbiobacteriaceae bacterium]